MHLETESIVCGQNYILKIGVIVNGKQRVVLTIEGALTALCLSDTGSNLSSFSVAAPALETRVLIAYFFTRVPWLNWTDFTEKNGKWCL